MVSFNQNKFVVKKKYFYYVTFFSSNFIMTFSFGTFLMTVYGLPFYLRTVARCCKKAAKKDSEYLNIVQ